jgi:hypothetical protein
MRSSILPMCRRVRFGSKAEVELPDADFRFIPQSRRMADCPDYPLGANTGGMAAAARRDRPQDALAMTVPAQNKIADSHVIGIALVNSLCPFVAERRRRRTAVNCPSHINTASDLSKTASGIIGLS